jgi:hypothetical protein
MDRVVYLCIFIHGTRLHFSSQLCMDAVRSSFHIARFSCPRVWLCASFATCGQAGHSGCTSFVPVANGPSNTVAHVNNPHWHACKIYIFHAGLHMGWQMAQTHKPNTFLSSKDLEEPKNISAKGSDKPLNFFFFGRPPFGPDRQTGV